MEVYWVVVYSLSGTDQPQMSGLLFPAVKSAQRSGRNHWNKILRGRRLLSGCLFVLCCLSDSYPHEEIKQSISRSCL